jgi:hypothetical protein
VDDASGHHTSGYYWGNNYWTGSMSLCRSIYKHDDDEYHIKRKQSAKLGLSFNENAANVQIDHENPPFVPRFGVLKIVFRESHTTPNVRHFNSHISHTLITHFVSLSLSLTHSFAASNTLHRRLFAKLVREK